MNFVRAVAYHSYLAGLACSIHATWGPPFSRTLLGGRLPVYQTVKKKSGWREALDLLACLLGTSRSWLHQSIWIPRLLFLPPASGPLAVPGKEINDAALPDSSASAATSSPWLPSPRWPQIIQGLITKGNFATADVTNMIVSFIRGHHKSKAFWGHP